MQIEILILLIAFQIKHFLADYPLQFPFMYENKGKATNWTISLASHAMVHATMTFTISIIFISIYSFPSWIPWIAFLFDFITHFIIDRWKATRKGGPDTSGFWINLGLDQMFHHLVGIIIIYIIVT